MNKYNPNIHHRRSIRLKGYDYSQAGLYFITICCEDRAHLFGEIVEAKGIHPNDKRPEMILNEYGQIAHNEWLNTSELRKNVELDVFVIMPNHIHGIIILNDTGRGELHSPNNICIELHSPDNAHAELHSPNIICTELHSSNNAPDQCNSPDINQGGLNTPIPRDNKMGDNKTGECNSPPPGPSNSIGAIVRGFKSSVTKQLNLLNIGCTVWQRNYYEHIIRNEQSYQRISNYIINNPVKWQDDKFYTKKNRQGKIRKDNG